MLAAEHLGEVADPPSSATSSTRPGAPARSWFDIGARMSVWLSRAKRFVPKADTTIDPNEGFARFTPRAGRDRRAQDAARDINATEITPDHLILGLLGDEARSASPWSGLPDITPKPPCGAVRLPAKHR